MEIEISKGDKKLKARGFQESSSFRLNVSSLMSSRMSSSSGEIVHIGRVIITTAGVVTGNISGVVQLTTMGFSRTYVPLAIQQDSQGY
jgi:hypothetical protein